MIATVVFDNYPGGSGLRTGWGFACHLQLPDATVLFDTGADGGILTENMRALGLQPDRIDLVVLSHEHGDHTGGLRDILRQNPGARVCVLGSFPDSIKRIIRDAGATTVEAAPGHQLAEGVYTTGAVSGPPQEQALVVNTAEGLVVITGCAHPGVDRMVRTAIGQHGGKVALVFGGFHLSSASHGRITEMARSLQEMGVRKAGPCHCSGDSARSIFAEIFGDDYVDVHVGTRFELEPIAAGD